MMTPRTLRRDDLDFLLGWLGLPDLLARPRYSDYSAETVAAILDTAQRLAENEFLPHYKAADRDEPQLTDSGVFVHPEVRAAVIKFAELGLMAGPFDAEMGGLQLPEIVHAAVMAQCMAANLATSAYPMLTIGNARLIAAFGTPEQVDAFVKPQIGGAALGTMCLSEPQAGSSLADITTRAEPDGDSPLGPRYRLRGNKMWISGGDSDIAGNIFHLVLAKVPDASGQLAPGTGGISLFVVPKVLDLCDGSRTRNDVVVAGLNHKMGYRGTANCLLNFGEGGQFLPEGRAGAVGYRIGPEGAGLAQMFHMMNEARIAVGLGAAAVACRSHLLSVDYATDRLQGRIPGARTEGQVPIIQHADVRRMLVAQKSWAEGALALVLYAARLIDDAATAPTPEARAEAQLCLDILTPVAKTWPSEWGLAACDTGIQVHGGYGYTREFDVEQLYRDNRLNPIHEGTTGIQGMDLVGRKIRKEGAAGLAVLAHRVNATLTAAESCADLADLCPPLRQRWDAVVAAADLLMTRPEGQIAWNATDFLSAFGHVVVAWLWLDQAVHACGPVPALRDFLSGKVRTARHFIEAELPRADIWLDAVTAGRDTAATFPVEFLNPRP